MLVWVLELLIGTWLVLWVRKQLPQLLERLDRLPLTTTQLPKEDTPEIKFGALLGCGAFFFLLILVTLINWTISAPVAFMFFCVLPILGALLQQRLMRWQLAAGHPWRVLVEQLAQQVGVGPVQVLLVQSTRLQVMTQGRSTILLPSCLLRHFSTAELRFLIALALWEARGGQSQSDRADQFALSLTQDLATAQSALMGLHKHQDVGNYLPKDLTEKRIERLTSWWKRQQVQTTLVPPPSVTPMHRVGRP